MTNYKNHPEEIKKLEDFILDIELTRILSLRETTNYEEMILQLGYISLFASALPTAAFFAFLHNLWNVKGELSALVDVSRRPMAKANTNIGAWSTILMVFLHL